MKNFKIFTIFFILIVFSACGIFKKNNNINKDNNNQHTSKSVPSIDVLNAIDSLDANYLDYNTLTIKFSADYLKDEKKTVLKGLLKFKKDSFIWGSIRPGLGIELARFLFTKDSIKFIDRYHHEYFVGDYSFLEKKFKIKLDFNTVQSLLTNEFFIYPPKPIIPDNLVGYTLINSTTNYTLSQQFTIEKFLNTQEIKFNSTDYKIITNSAVIGSEKRTLTVNYSNFKLINNQSFPTLINSIFINNEKSLIFNLKYDKIIYNKTTKPTFVISDKYKQIYFE